MLAALKVLRTESGVSITTPVFLVAVTALKQKMPPLKRMGLVIRGQGRFGAAVRALDISATEIWVLELSGARIFFLDSFFFLAMLIRFVARFARVRIEDSSRNRFVLNGIQGIACFIVFSS